jgi:hypothetical protein
MLFAHHGFALEAYQNESYVPAMSFQQPVRITIHYADEDVIGLKEDMLELRYWTGSGWDDVAHTCTPTSAYEHHPDENWLAVSLCHLSEFALVAPGQHASHLPMTVR